MEYLDWYSCIVPEGVTPINQDGEVSQFRLMQPEEVVHLMLGDEFTLEAALILNA